MAKCLFIVQGEGRGHMSQAMALKEILEDAGHTIEAVFTGNRTSEAIPTYFTEFFPGQVRSFFSPYFLRTPNKKGIYVGRTLLFNITHSLKYLREAFRIRKKINELRPDVVFNFYDLVGAIALKKVNPGIKRIGIGHHFYLHLNGYQCNNGSVCHRWLLSIHTSLIMRACDRVLALSFREAEGNSSITVIPPLLRRAFTEINYKPLDRYLVYFLNDGFIFDLIRISQEDPGFLADVFTSITMDYNLPSGIKIHPLDHHKFKEKMAVCKGLITTSGFDTLTEAAYQGIPMVVVPSQHHFEQRCNGMDLERTGMGNVVDKLEPGIHDRMNSYDNNAYRQWVDRAGEMILKSIKE